MQALHVILGLVLVGITQYAFAENYQVTILDNTSDQRLKIYPEVLPFKQDDTITWKNEDSVIHSITSGIGTHPEYSGKFFRTGEIAPGESGKVKFDVRDNFAFYYFCEIHPWLSGKLVVETAPESQPETTNTILIDSSHDKITVSGQEHYDFRKTAYDILMYHNQDELIDVKHGLLDESSTFSEDIPIGTINPGKYTFKVVYGLPTQVGITDIEITSQIKESIPKWIRVKATEWSNDTISNAEFIKAIEYLVKEKIIKIQKNESLDNAKTIPSWLKSNAGWWSNGQISDVEFTKSLQYLSDVGIIQI